MSTELSNGVIIPEEYSDDWYDEMSINLRKLNDVITAASDNATNIQRLDTDKANQSDLTALTSRVSQNETDIIALQTAVSGALKREIVQTLPTEDISTTTIYMIRNSQSSGTNIYDEYMYINNLWELIGTSATDFSNYYTKTETDTLLSGKADDNTVVHTSGSETVSGQKTFSDDLLIYNSDNSVDTPRLKIKTSKYVKGDTTNTDTMRINFLDSNGNNVASVYANKNTGGSQYLSFQIYTTDNNNANITSTINYYISKSGDKYFIPYEDNQIGLGGTVRRWKSVYATSYYYGSNNVEFSTKFVTTDTNQTISGNKTFSSINGVEPSSLSLPSGNASNFIDISSYFSNTGSGDTNSYTALANGWIYLRLTNIDGCQLSILDSSNNRLYGSTSSGNLEQLCLPVTAGTVVETQWTTSSSVTVAIARFIPCQGNI